MKEGGRVEEVFARVWHSNKPEKCDQASSKAELTCAFIRGVKIESLAWILNMYTFVDHAIMINDERGINENDNSLRMF